MTRRTALWMIAFALCVAGGYWLARSAAPRSVESPVRSVKSIVPTPLPSEVSSRKFNSGTRSEKKSGKDAAALAAGAFANQRTLRFANAEALAAFLARAGAKVKVLGRLDKLNALRVGFGSYDDLASALGGDEEEGFVFPVYDPGLPEGSVQPGALGLGSGLLAWLGVTGDNSAWGAGVKVAVLDSGVAAHPSLRGNIAQVALVALPSDPSAMDGHGTAVASLIAGKSAVTPGVAPGVNLLSVRVADDNGMSDSFLLSQGIIAAVDQGAHLINISMGSQGDSALVKAALKYAADAGALVIAAAGNNGTDQVSYPAANEGVIAVGAVDAAGDHLDFSNSGTQIALAAPGYSVNAAGTDGGAVSASGTSFSAPIVTGVIAAVMSEAGGGTLTPAQAYALVGSYLNDTGSQGADAGTGGGMPDLSRILQRDTSGVYDAALASAQLQAASSSYPNGSVNVLVQNRGTETLINTAVTVDMGGGSTTATITSLMPNGSKTVTVPVMRPASASSEPLRVDARVSLPDGTRDAKSRNDASVRTYVAGGD